MCRYTIKTMNLERLRRPIIWNRGSNRQEINREYVDHTSLCVISWLALYWATTAFSVS